MQPDIQCPLCGTVVWHGCGVTRGKPPGPGAFIVCNECATLLEFVDAQRAKIVSPVEFAALPSRGRVAFLLWRERVLTRRIKLVLPAHLPGLEAPAFPMKPRRLETELAAAVAIASGFILFTPEDAMPRLVLERIREAARPWYGAAFVLSCSLLLSHAVAELWGWAWRRWEARMER